MRLSRFCCTRRVMRYEAGGGAMPPSGITPRVESPPRALARICVRELSLCYGTSTTRQVGTRSPPG